MTDQVGAKGYGSVYRRGDGRWVAQVEDGNSASGRRRYRRRARSTEAEAILALGQLRDEVGARSDTASYVIDDSMGCWVWQRRFGTDGYPQISIGGTVLQAHRVFYDLHVGPIMAGMTIDHICMNRACVNPRHLDQVSRALNSRRIRAAEKAGVR